MGALLGITSAIGSGKTTFAEYLANTAPDHAHYETWHVVADIADAFNQALKAELAFETADNNIELANQVLIWLPDAISEHLHHDVVWNQLAITKHAALTHPDTYDKLFVYLQKIRQDQSLLDTPLTDETKDQFRPLLQWLGNYLIATLSKTIWYDELLRRIDLHDPTTSLVVIGGVRYPSDALAVRKHNGKIIFIERPGNTEKVRATIEPDITIINSGTLEQLQTTAETLWNDIASNKPRRLYTTKNTIP